MSRQKIIIKALLSITISLAAITTGHAQNNTAALAAADTSMFSINNAEGWQLYNAFLTPYQSDSVQLELIIQHNNINLQQERYVGKIKYGPFKPQATQMLAYSLLTDNYALRIEADGRCYLKWVSGNVPVPGPVVLPIKVFYKL